MGLHDGHRQRAKDRYRQLGADALADHELLELALFYAIPRQDTNETAHRLLKRFRSLQGVLQATPEELEREEGVGRSAALLLCLIGDISRRARITSLPEKILNSPDRTGAYFMELLTGQKRELLYQVCLDGKGKLLTCAASARAPSPPRRSMCGRWWRTPCTPEPVPSFWRTTTPAAWPCPPTRMCW